MLGEDDVEPVAGGGWDVVCDVVAWGGLEGVGVRDVFSGEDFGAARGEDEVAVGEAGGGRAV